MRVSLLKVETRTRELSPLLEPFIAEIDEGLLPELGVSFRKRGGDRGDVWEFGAESFVGQDDAADSSSSVDPNGPSVVLYVLYDGRPIDVSFRDGEAWIPEPREGTTVTFRIERTDRGDRPIAAVFKVNGVNSLLMQRGSDFECSKWVLNPGDQPLTITGFQMEDRTVRSFRIASDRESREKAFDYGDDVGLISLVVFEQQTEPVDPGRSEVSGTNGSEGGIESTDSVLSDADVRGIRRASFPDSLASSVAELADHLRRDNRARSKGLILPGAERQSEVRWVDHEWSPRPIMAAVIRYHRPIESP